MRVYADVCITTPAFVSPATYFINDIYNLCPCNIASSKLWKLGEHSSSVGKPLGCGSCFPTLLVFSQLPACSGEAMSHGNALYISKIRNIRACIGDEIVSTFTAFTWPWRRTKLTTRSDVKYTYFRGTNWSVCDVGSEKMSRCYWSSPCHVSSVKPLTKRFGNKVFDKTTTEEIRFFSYHCVTDAVVLHAGKAPCFWCARSL